MELSEDCWDEGNESECCARDPEAIIEMFDADNSGTMCFDEFANFFNQVNDGTIVWPEEDEEEVVPDEDDDMPTPDEDDDMPTPDEDDEMPTPDEDDDMPTPDEDDKDDEEFPNPIPDEDDDMPTPDEDDDMPTPDEDDEFPNPIPTPDTVESIFALCDVDPATVGYLDATEIPVCYSTICGHMCATA